MSPTLDLLHKEDQNSWIFEVVQTNPNPRSADSISITRRFGHPGLQDGVPLVFVRTLLSKGKFTQRNIDLRCKI